MGTVMGAIFYRVMSTINWIYPMMDADLEQENYERQQRMSPGDTTVPLWRAADGALLRTLEGHSFQVTSVAVSPDGGTLVSGSVDKTVRLWRLAGGMLLHTLYEEIRVCSRWP